MDGWDGWKGIGGQAIVLSDRFKAPLQPIMVAGKHPRAGWLIYLFLNS